MVVNFSKNLQFSTDIQLGKESVETVSEAKLLGTTITDNLRWNKNTSKIVKKAYRRMQLLNRAANFTTNRRDLRSIYLTYIRSVLEQSAVVWHSSLTVKNRRDLERVQKCAVRVILARNYASYKDGLQKLNLETLNDRRKIFA